MVFSISNRIIFTSAYCLFSHSRMKIVITQNQIAIHIVITELACPSEHVNCINYINITVLRPWKQIFWNFKEAYDQTYNYFRWGFSIIVTKLWVYLRQFINSDTEENFLGTLVKGHSNTGRSSAFGHPHGNNCCKINVLEMEVLLLLTIKQNYVKPRNRIKNSSVFIKDYL